MCVLIVEDELLIRMGTAVTMEEAGYEVVCACDAQEAIELIDQRDGGLTAMVTDYHMPGRLTGADVVQHLRRALPRIPVYLVSARTNVVTETWRDEHAVTVLSKPYEPEVLVHLMRVAIAEAARARPEP